MEPIQEINEVSIRIVNTPSWMYTPPSVPNTYVPVTINLGFPIVNMPGCVEAHPDNKTQIGPNGLPLDRNLVNDDEAGVKILCPDGQFPSYDPINFEPEQVIPTVAAPPPPVDGGKLNSICSLIKGLSSSTTASTVAFLLFSDPLVT